MELVNKVPNYQQNQDVPGIFQNPFNGELVLDVLTLIFIIPSLFYIPVVTVISSMKFFAGTEYSTTGL
jgi:hypothetical protein